MKIQLFSDLHLEFHTPTRQMENPDADVIILSGDIHNGLMGADWILDKFTKPCIYVSGNHEGYDHDYPKFIEAARERFKGTNVRFLHNESVEINGVWFLGTTLWTDLTVVGVGHPNIDRAIGRKIIVNELNDFVYIKYNGLNFTADHWLEEHRNAVDFLNQELSLHRNDTCVVVTHHLPHPRAIDQRRYGGQLVNIGYANDMTEMMVEFKPKLWTFGHTHSSNDFYIDETRCVSNPRGYTNSEDHEQNIDFDWDLLIEI